MCVYFRKLFRFFELQILRWVSTLPRLQMLIYGIFLLCVYRMTMSLFVCLLVRLSLSNSSSVLLLGSTLCKDLRLYLSKCFTPGSMDSQLQQVIRENLYLRAVPCEYPKKDCSEVALLEIKIPIFYLTRECSREKQIFFQKHRMFVQNVHSSGL